MINEYLYIGFAVLILIFLIVSYNKNKQNDDDDSEEEFEQPSSTIVSYDELDVCNCPCHEMHGSFHLNPCCEKAGNRPLRPNDINPQTGLNSFGCNCNCHKGEYVEHLVPCCGMTSRCGCLCHSGHYVYHNVQCCVNQGKIEI